MLQLSLPHEELLMVELVYLSHIIVDMHVLIAVTDASIQGVALSLLMLQHVTCRFFLKLSC